jgi:SAM-dependent methyltransferase
VNPREYDALFEVEERHWWFEAVRRDVVDAVERHRPSRDFGRGLWLDAGCGTGGLLAFSGRFWSGKRIGIDFSFDALRRGRARRLRGLARASADRLPFGDGSLALVTSVDVLCHREVDPRGAVAEAARCLGDGGLLVLQVPAFDRLRSEHDEAVWTARRFSRGEISSLVREAGLRVLECSYTNVLLFPAVALARLAKPRPASAGRARSDVKPAGPAANFLLSAVRGAERPLRRVGIALPFGLSVFCVCQKGGGSGGRGEGER